MPGQLTGQAVLPEWRRGRPKASATAMAPVKCRATTRRLTGQAATAMATWTSKSERYRNGPGQVPSHYPAVDRAKPATAMATWTPELMVK